jgi:hypothetical protein
MKRNREESTSAMEEDEPSPRRAAPEVIPTVDAGGMVLPVDMWILVCQNLAYHDVVSMAAVNSVFIKEVFPKLKNLYVFELKDLSEPQARRIAHGSIHYVRLGILDEMSGSSQADATRNITRVVSFLSHLPKLSRVDYGQNSCNYGRVDREIFVPWNGKQNLRHGKQPFLRSMNLCEQRRSNDTLMRNAVNAHHGLVEAIQRAINEGSISRDVRFQGFIPTQQNEDLCDDCKRARGVLLPVESA